MTVNEQFYNALVQHQIYLLKYSASVRNQIVKILNQCDEQLAKELLLMKRNPLKTKADWQRLQALQQKIEGLRAAAWGEATSFLNDEMGQYTHTEATLLKEITQSVVPVVLAINLPSPNLLKSIVKTRPFSGRLLKDWAENMASSDIARIQAAVQNGLILGNTNAQITKAVIGSSTLKGLDGVTEITRRQVHSVVRTAVMHFSNQARNEFFQENKDLFNEEVFVATLDQRTTPLCASLDGKRFKIGEGPIPPLHMQCRSLRVANIDGAFLGERPAKPFTEKELLKEWGEGRGFESLNSRDQIPRGYKKDFDQWKKKKVREMTGRVPASTNYGDWLKAQSVDFQNEILGKTKAKLFRDGGLTLTHFVDKDGSTLTLAELAAKYENKFKKAGLNPDKFK